MCRYTRATTGQYGVCSSPTTERLLQPPQRMAQSESGTLAGAATPPATAAAQLSELCMPRMYGLASQCRSLRLPVSIWPPGADCAGQESQRDRLHAVAACKRNSDCGSLVGCHTVSLVIAATFNTWGIHGRWIWSDICRCGVSAAC